METKGIDIKEVKVEEEMGKGGNNCAHVQPPSTRVGQEKPRTYSNKGQERGK